MQVGGIHFEGGHRKNVSAEKDEFNLGVLGVPLQNPRQCITIEHTEEANHEALELGKLCKAYV